MGAYVVVLILALLVCVLLTLIVLVQESKGGGLASNFAGNNQFMGVRKTADFLEKSTWTLAIALLVLSLFSAVVIPRGARTQKAENLTSEVLKQQQEAAKKAVDYTPAPGAENMNTPAEPEE